MALIRISHLIHITRVHVSPVPVSAPQQGIPEELGCSNVTGEGDWDAAAQPEPACEGEETTFPGAKQRWPGGRRRGRITCTVHWRMGGKDIWATMHAPTHHSPRTPPRPSRAPGIIAGWSLGRLPYPPVKDGMIQEAKG